MHGFLLIDIECLILQIGKDGDKIILVEPDKLFEIIFLTFEISLILKKRSFILAAALH